MWCCSSATRRMRFAMKTLHSLNWLPQMIIGDSAGFSDPSFVSSVGPLAQGVLNRSAWSLGKPDGLTAKVNALYKAKTGRDMSDASGLVMQAFIVLADAINRAGSTDPGRFKRHCRRRICQSRICLSDIVG